MWPDIFRRGVSRQRQTRIHTSCASSTGLALQVSRLQQRLAAYRLAVRRFFYAADRFGVFVALYHRYELWHETRSMFHQMSRVLVAAILLSVAVTGNSQTPNATHVKRDAIYAPRPNYPLYARQYHQTGEGLFACQIRPDGTVASVDVLRSTSHDMLDRAAIKALRQWRFRAGDWSRVNVPINFYMSGKGSPIRHRMSGAVIPD